MASTGIKGQPLRGATSRHRALLRAAATIDPAAGAQQGRRGSGGWRAEAECSMPRHRQPRGLAPTARNGKRHANPAKTTR